MAGQLRVIAGKWARRKLPLAAAADAGITRPTSDRAREALFSALGDSVAGAQVLDLFAGSGALGIEALSRGAEHATFVERDESCIQQLAQNLQKLNAQDETQCLATNAYSWVQKSRGKSYDLIFVDPPYDTDFQDEFWPNLAQHLAPEGLVVVERSKKRQFEGPTGFDVVWDRCYGKPRLLWLRKETP